VAYVRAAVVRIEMLPPKASMVIEEQRVSNSTNGRHFLIEEKKHVKNI
jgi:hypothetical protein